RGARKPPPATLTPRRGDLGPALAGAAPESGDGATESRDALPRPLLVPPPDDEADRDAGEVQVLAETVLQVAAVVGVPRQRAVGEEHEGGRRRRHLGRVVELPGAAALG